MKKLYFFCIALVALMLASCGGKDYREMLPADSFRDRFDQSRIPVPESAGRRFYPKRLL